jgi:hypothetical protein
MEKGEGLTPDQREKYFKLDLMNAPEDVRDRYYKLLLGEQIRMAKLNNNRPAGPVSIDLREMMLEISGRTNNHEEAQKLFKMERDWNNASRTDRHGNVRPPIGGAPDD